MSTKLSVALETIDALGRQQTELEEALEAAEREAIAQRIAANDLFVVIARIGEALGIPDSTPYLCDRVAAEVAILKKHFDGKNFHSEIGEPAPVGKPCLVGGIPAVKGEDEQWYTNQGYPLFPMYWSAFGWRPDAESVTKAGGE